MFLLHHFNLELLRNKTFWPLATSSLIFLSFYDVCTWEIRTRQQICSIMLPSRIGRSICLNNLTELSKAQLMKNRICKKSFRPFRCLLTRHRFSIKQFSRNNSLQLQWQDHFMIFKMFLHHKIYFYSNWMFANNFVHPERESVRLTLLLREDRS